MCPSRSLLRTNCGTLLEQSGSPRPRETISDKTPAFWGRLSRLALACALLPGLSACFETEYGPLLAGRPFYKLIHFEESYDTVCAIPSTASIDTSLDAHPEHRRNLLDYSIDDEGREVVRNHAHESYGLSDFHAERRPDYDDERGEAWLTFVHGEHVQAPPEGQEFAIGYRTGRDCLPENRIMAFPYVVDAEPPVMQIVAIPIVVDGVEPKLRPETFLDPFYKSILEIFPITEISMHNREADDPDLRILVPVDSPAFDRENGTLNLTTLTYDPTFDTRIADTTLAPLVGDFHRPREIFMGFYDKYDEIWRERFGRSGLRPFGNIIRGGTGFVIFPANNPGGVAHPPSVWPMLSGPVHEIGHAMALAHAPCGGAGGPDPLFPHEDGGLGGAVMWGESRNSPDDYHARGPLLSDDAGYADIMGACFPHAIAPYHFKKALDWMVWGLDAWEREIFGEANAGPSLALSGHIDDSGVPVVTSASVSPMPPHAQTGPFSVAVLDEAGFAVGKSAFRGRANYAGENRLNDLWSVRVPVPGSVGGAQITDADGGLLSTARLNARPGRRFELVQ